MSNSQAGQNIWVNWASQRMFNEWQKKISHKRLWIANDNEEKKTKLYCDDACVTKFYCFFMTLHWFKSFSLSVLRYVDSIPSLYKLLYIFFWERESLKFNKSNSVCSPFIVLWWKNITEKNYHLLKLYFKVTETYWGTFSIVAVVTNCFLVKRFFLNEQLTV